MNVVEMNSVGAPKNKPKRSSAGQHLVNAGITVGGLYGINKLRKEGCFDAFLVDCNERRLHDGSTSEIAIGRVKRAFVKGFQKLGERLFRSPRAEGLITKFMGGYSIPAEAKFELKYNKGVLAQTVCAGVAAIGLVVRGIYKAGKINGEKAQ